MRINTKVDILDFTSRFAYGHGYKLTWNITPAPKKPPKKKPDPPAPTLEPEHHEVLHYYEAHPGGDDHHHEAFFSPHSSPDMHQPHTRYGEVVYNEIPNGSYHYQMNYHQYADPYYYHYRALYQSIESTLERYGYEGRACLIRAICETVMIRNHDDIVSKVLKVLFRAKEAFTCPTDINCPFSLIALAYMIYGEDNQF